MFLIAFSSTRHALCTFLFFSCCDSRPPFKLQVACHSPFLFFFLSPITTLPRILFTFSQSTFSQDSTSSTFYPKGPTLVILDASDHRHHGYHIHTIYYDRSFFYAIPPLTPHTVFQAYFIFLPIVLQYSLYTTTQRTATTCYLLHVTATCYI